MRHCKDVHDTCLKKEILNNFIFSYLFGGSI